ncbi:unnamed protein product, partial [Adineta steineri]
LILSSKPPSSISSKLQAKLHSLTILFLTKTENITCSSSLCHQQIKDV